jgi:hypothetical protein
MPEGYRTKHGCAINYDFQFFLEIFQKREDAQHNDEKLSIRSNFKKSI